MNAIGEWLDTYDPGSWNGEFYYTESPLLNFSRLKPVYSFEENPVYLWILKKLDEVEELMMNSEVLRYEIC